MFWSTLQELENVGIRLNKKPPDVTVRPTKGGGPGWVVERCQTTPQYVLRGLSLHGCWLPCLHAYRLSQLCEDWNFRPPFPSTILMRRFVQPSSSSFGLSPPIFVHFQYGPPRLVSWRFVGERAYYCRYKMHNADVLVREARTRLHHERLPQQLLCFSTKHWDGIWLDSGGWSGLHRSPGPPHNQISLVRGMKSIFSLVFRAGTDSCVHLLKSANHFVHPSQSNFNSEANDDLEWVWDEVLFTVVYCN